MSNWTKWPIITESPMNSEIFSFASSNVIASFNSSSVIPVKYVINSGILVPGLINICKVLELPFRSNFMAPNSIMRSMRLSSPVVSRSNETNMFILLK